MSEYIENDKNGISVGLVEKKYFTFAEPPDSMVLESNARLGPITIAYETLGTLNEDKSNVILVLHALSGDSHIAGYYGEEDRKPGWWEIMVGPGKGIDTDKYFVICPNIIGSCMGSTGPSSINPETGEPYGFDFPVVTIGDMVKAQKALLDHLGIEKILTVVGGSIGGMQVLEWAVRYPGIVFSAIPLATTTRHSALAIAFNEVLLLTKLPARPSWPTPIGTWGNITTLTSQTWALPWPGWSDMSPICLMKQCEINSGDACRIKTIFPLILMLISRLKATCATRARSL
jgi:homoserine O-acetyltransferase